MSLTNPFKLQSLLTCAAALGVLSFEARADQVVLDDLLARSRLCVGNNCADGMNFGHDTLVLQTSNIGLLFSDTSVNTFPTADWRLVANDRMDGGEGYFALEDVELSHHVFVVEDSIPENSLYVAAGGRVGLKTSNPDTELHLVDGDTATIRLEQDGSSGFSPYAWDVAANEVNFFVRDVSNSASKPFRIRAGATDDSLVIGSEGDIGIGESRPDASLHIRRVDGTSQLLIQEESGTRAARELIRFENNGGSWITFVDTSNDREWYFTHENNPQGRFFINHSDGGLQMALTRGGDLSVLGTITAGGTQLNVPDYVFDDDYALRPLSEVQAFIDANSHLPEVPSAAEITAGGLDMTNMQMTLLKKVEELTLYTLGQEARLIEQQTLIEAERSENLALQDSLAAQRGETEALREQVQQLTVLVSRLSDAVSPTKNASEN